MLMLKLPAWACDMPIPVHSAKPSPAQTASLPMTFMLAPVRDPEADNAVVIGLLTLQGIMFSDGSC